MISDATLLELARLTSQAELLDERAEQVARAVATDGCTCAVRWWQAEQVVTLAAAGPEVAAVMAPEPPVLQEAMRGERPVEVPDLLAQHELLGDSAWLQVVLAAGLRSLLLIPCATPDGCGYLALYSPDSHLWSSLSPDRRELLAHLTAVGLDLQPEPLAPPDLGEAYRDTLVALHLDRDGDDVCRRAVDHLRQPLAADWVMVARCEAEGAGFDCHFLIDRLSIAADDSPLLSRVARGREAVEATPIEDGDLLVERLNVAGIRAALTLPLLFQGQSFGVLQVGYRDPARLTAHVRLAAEQLAFHVALALRDAALLRDQAAAVARLRQAQEEATQGAKFRALAQMAGGVAHEFNNALGGILARTQMLQRQTQDRRILKGLSTIAEIGWRAAETVRRLQEFTRERSDDDFEPVAVETLWQRLCEATRQQVAAHSRFSGHRYLAELEAEDLRGVLLANPNELVEAVGNVITNALEATAGGGVITLHASPAVHHLYLTIVDRGRGMTPEELQSCFDPFFSTKAETGVGLGLSVTYGIISRHGGEIEIDSAPGHGTTVSIQLPFVEANVDDSTDTTHVLVIDDEAALCEVLAELFGTAGYTVDTCAGGREGIERFQGRHYDLVCTDLRTEDLSGWEVIRAIKESGRGTPVMLLTGFREQLRQDQIEESGVDAVLGKPFTLQQVMETASKLLTPA